MSLRRIVVVFSITGVLFAGCGGDSNDAAPPPSLMPTIALSPDTLAMSPVSPTPPTSLPPTWTPRPTLTPAPQEVLPSSTPRPTATHYIIPTYTPYPVADEYPVITAENAAQLVKIVRHEKFVYDFAWGPDGSLAMAMNDGARVYPGFNLSAVPLLLRDEDNSQRRLKMVSVAVSPDGVTAATGNGYGEVRIWDLTTQRERFLLADHSFDINDLVFGPDDTTLYVASFERVVRVWDTETGESLGMLDLEGGSVPYRLAIHPSGSPLLATSVASRTLYAWDTQTGDLIITQPAAQNAIGLAISSDGQWVAYSDRQTVSVWAFDTLLSPTGEPLALLEHDAEIWEVAFSPDGQLLAVALSDGTVRVWDRASAAQVATLPVTDVLNRTLSFSPDGKFLLTASPDGLWSLWGVP